jgi:hypothetical protein
MVRVLARTKRKKNTFLNWLTITILCFAILFDGLKDLPAPLLMTARA